MNRYKMVVLSMIKKDKNKGKNIKEIQYKDLEIYKLLKKFNLIQTEKLYICLLTYVCSLSNEKNKIWLLHLGNGGIGKSYNTETFFNNLFGCKSISITSPENLIQNIGRENKDKKMLIFGELDELLSMYKENIIIVFKKLKDGNILLDYKTTRKNNDNKPIEYKFNSSIIANVNQLNKFNENIKAVYDRFLIIVYNLTEEEYKLYVRQKATITTQDYIKIKNIVNESIKIIPQIQIKKDNKLYIKYSDKLINLLSKKIGKDNFSFRYHQNFITLIKMNTALKNEIIPTETTYKEVLNIFSKSLKDLDKYNKKIYSKDEYKYYRNALKLKFTDNTLYSKDELKLIIPQKIRLENINFSKKKINREIIPKIIQKNFTKIPKKNVKYKELKNKYKKILYTNKSPKYFYRFKK